MITGINQPADIRVCVKTFVSYFTQRWRKKSSPAKQPSHVMPDTAAPSANARS